jgi:DNA-binding XRE family transcriptional regulator
MAGLSNIFIEDPINCLSQFPIDTLFLILPFIPYSAYLSPPEEIKNARFSPGLIQSLRKRLGITQKELAILAGVTVGAAHLWETGKFLPSGEKRGAIVALRKLRRREVRELLDQKRARKTGT